VSHPSLPVLFVSDLVVLPGMVVSIELDESSRAAIDAARALQIDGEVGTLTPGKRADLAVVSLAESPYHPVEDPAAAVVFGGSPERVLETVVNGQTRYRIEDNEWREVRNIASAARGRMLAPPPR